MSAFEIGVMPVKGLIDDLSSVASQYEDYAGEVGNTASKINYEGFEDYVKQITDIYKQALEESNELYKMQSALSRIWELYVDTERVLAGEDAVGKAFGDVEAMRDNEIYKILKSLMVRGVLGDGNMEALLEIFGGTFMTSKRVNGMIYFMLKNNGMTNAECMRWLNENLGGSWTKDLARKLRRGDVNVFNTDTDSLTRNSRHFMDVDDPRISKYLNELGDTNWTRFKNNFNMLDDFNYKDFKNYTKLGKAGKVLGTAGTVISMGTDVFDNCYDAKTGSWNFTPETVIDSACDIGVDLGAGAGATAFGAAVGSAFVPPVGTVVGAGVGMLTDVAANADIIDFDGDGQKDSLVDGGKMLVKGAVDVVGDGIDKVGDWLGDLF